MRRALLFIGAVGLAATAVFWMTLPDVSGLATAWPKTTSFMHEESSCTTPSALGTPPKPTL